MSDPFGSGQGDVGESYEPSTHKFNDPIRYFKANDPYYWEIDNIPLQQLQENILWLKDQVGTTDAGGAPLTGTVGRTNFVELQPLATGGDNTVTVQPGRFMGRVNDAYKTGLSRLLIDKETNYGNEDFDKYQSIDLPDNVLYDLIGASVSGIIGNNGLYDHLQTHVANIDPNNPTSWRSMAGADTQNDLPGISNLPKIKLALWKQGTTAASWGPKYTDLQQLAVEWTRAWGAPFRTALVNVEEQLSIPIPLFSDKDYDKEVEGFTPTLRVDLLFVYTKPIDASATTIAKIDGGVPATITSPTLGLVRGAGIVSMRAKGKWVDNEVNSNFLGDDGYLLNKDDPGYFLSRENTESFDNNNHSQIASPIGDLYQSEIGTSGMFGNFPSPDDLMNLAPYLAEELTDSAGPYAFIGQSVLPIAYIFVKRGASTITNNDILDIRPFFRTTELAYNERCGIAGANPPASLANPFVTDRDISNRITKLYELIKTLPFIDENWDLFSPPPQRAPPSLGLVAAGGFEQDSSRTDTNAGYIGGDQLNIASNNAMGSDTTKVSFTTAMKDTNYVVRCRSITKWSHRKHSNESRYNTVYVSAGRTEDYFVLKHQSPTDSDGNELFVTYEVYEYNYDEDE